MAGPASAAEVIAEFQTSVSEGPHDRRVLMLRRVTHLLLSVADRLNDEHLAIFDAVIVRLIEHMEAPALVRLSSALAGLSMAPKQAARALALHKEIAVAAPILSGALSLSDAELLELANAVALPQLAAMARRRTLDQALTQILLKRGDIGICRALARNAGARFSDEGYSLLIAAAGRNADIAETLGLRSDMPTEKLRELLASATDTVRLKILKAAPPKLRQNIRDVLDGIAAHVSTKTPEPAVYSEAQAEIGALNISGKLNDSAISGFALHRETTKVVVSLSLLSGAPIKAIEPLMEARDCDGLIVACRASRLDWQTVLAIIRSRSVPQFTEAELSEAKEKFEKLPLYAAQRSIRFGT